MEKLTLTKRELLELNSSLNNLSLLKYPNADIDFIFHLAENKSKINRVAEPIIDARDMIFRSFALKENDGTPVSNEGQYMFADKSLPKMNDKLKELLDEKVGEKLELNKLEKKQFKGIEDMLPAYLAGIIQILE